MKIKSHIKEYEVSLLDTLPKAVDIADGSNVFYVVDHNVYRLYPSLFDNILQDQLYVFEATEEHKNIMSALDICDKFTKVSAKRNAVLVSYGGGIVQDITGFVANILYRGIEWLFVPTTLLASCDSCIGSKTSLNYNTFKNLLGTFYPPNHIYICPAFFKTLSDGDVKSGLGEVIKFNVMSGDKSLAALEKSLPDLMNLEEKSVLYFVQKSLAFKKPFIEEDEFDKGKRILLNFAHTFGHAIDVTSHYIIPHGSAVAMGMLMANSISHKRGILNNIIVKHIEAVSLPVLTMQVESKWFSSQELIQAIRKDKKQINNEITAILLDDHFELHIVHDLKESEIEYAVDYILKLLLTR